MINMSKVIHEPTLGTIRMVENALKRTKRYPSKNQLWRSLPKQMQYPTFKATLDYLEESKKIIYDRDGSIIWIFADNPKLKKLLRETTRFR